MNANARNADWVTLSDENMGQCAAGCCTVPVSVTQPQSLDSLDQQLSNDKPEPPYTRVLLRLQLMLNTFLP